MTRQKISKPMNKVIQIKVTSEFFEQFTEKAEQLNITRSDLGRQILEVFME